LNRSFRLLPAAVLLLVSVSVFWVGCSKNSDNITPEPETAIDLMAIICNPLAPSPGQTAQLTAQVGGVGENPVYQWQVQGGTLAKDDDITVQWQVPSEPGVYRVFLRASVGSAVDTMSKYVMVRNVTTINTGLKHTMYPNIIIGVLYFVGVDKNLTDLDFLGYHAYKNVQPLSPIDKPTTLSVDGGFEFTFYDDGILTSSITNGNQYFRQQPMNVYLFPYLMIGTRAVSNNELAGTAYRKNQNLHPSAAAAHSIVVWQYNKVGSANDGSKDLVNIRFRVTTLPIQTLTAAKDSALYHGLYTYTYYRNVKPMFTPDESEIIYFTDSTGTFEPCVIPMSGTSPDIALRRAIMTDARHGIFYYAGVKVSEKTIFQWNPAIPTQVGFIDDSKNFCLFDHSTEHVEIVPNVGKLSEFVWDPNGRIAAVNDAGVIVATPGEEPDTIFAKERSSDAVFGVNWSPDVDNQKLGFRMVRKGASSSESFAALVIYSTADDRWYYASPEIKPILANEPNVSYTWMRAAFDPATGGMYVPVPVSMSGSKTILYYSY
jgi:hypothetical protein